MNKMLAVIRREYLQAVRKKMFIIMTFLFPVLMASAFLLPTLLMAKTLSGRRIAIVDGTGRLHDAFVKAAAEKSKPADAKAAAKNRDIPIPTDYVYVDAQAGAEPEAQAQPYLDRLKAGDKNPKTKLDGVLVIPRDALTASEGHMKFYSRSATDFIAQEQLSSISNRSILRDRLVGRGIAAEDVEKLTARVDIDSVQLTKDGSEKKGGTANFILGFILAGLVLIPSFVYGMEIMRGIIQEKSDRVIEVLISSMSPMQLLVGKILGVALVGLTQVGAWILMLSALGAYVVGTASMMGVNVASMLHASTFVFFAIFFLLAYLTYVCVYAVAGAVCNSEKEAQQLIAPISMLMMIPWFLMFPIITAPESALAVGFSLSPVFGPLTMFVRTIVSEPPFWHVALSIAVSIATISVFFWATAKIFRVGILSYGKRPTLPELWRWLKVA